MQCQLDVGILFRKTCADVTAAVRKVAVAMDNGEYDFDGTSEKQVLAPIDIRVQEAIRENADLENLRHKISARDDDVMELRTQLKMKVRAYIECVAGVEVTSPVFVDSKRK